jgi:hypothetical protein
MLFCSLGALTERLTADCGFNVAASSSSVTATVLLLSRQLTCEVSTSFSKLSRLKANQIEEGLVEESLIVFFGYLGL